MIPHKTIFFIAIIVFTPQSIAAVATYSIGGEITFVDSSISTLSSGDSWTATISVNTSPDQLPGPPVLFLGPLSGTFTLGSSVNIGAEEFNLSQLRLVDNDILTNQDNLSFRLFEGVGLPFIENLTINLLAVELGDSSQTLFSGDSIEQTFELNAEDFDTTVFLINAQELPAAAILGNVTSYSVTVVPLPPSLFLFLFGLFSLLAWRKKFFLIRF